MKDSNFQFRSFVEADKMGQAVSLVVRNYIPLYGTGCRIVIDVDTTPAFWKQGKWRRKDGFPAQYAITDILGTVL